MKEIMSKRGFESINDSTESSRRTAASYQSIWRAHWNPASRKSTTEGRGDSARMDKELATDEDLSNRLETSRYVKGPSVIETETEVKMLSESLEEETDETGAIRSIFTTPVPFFRSSTQVVPDNEKNVFDKGKAIVLSSFNRAFVISNHQFQKSMVGILEQEYCHPSACLICEGGTSISMDACIKERNRSSLLEEMEDWSEMHQLPSIQKNESKISNYDNYSLQKLPSCDHELKAMRIYNTTDSVETTTGGHPWFSQTTRNLFIAKNDVFRSPNDVHNLGPFFGRANRGVKLQSLSSSSNSEGQKNVEDIGAEATKAAVENESSAETDAIIMGHLKEEERLASVANSARSTKGFGFGKKLSPRFDINSEPPPDSPAVGPTSSRTESLEFDLLLAPPDHPTPKSNHLEPTARWVKRLKVSSSDSSGRGTKITSSASEPTPRKNRGKEPMLTKDEQRRKWLLSHPWVQRWGPKGSQISQEKPQDMVLSRIPQKKPEATKFENGDPQSSKTDFFSKKSPSVAAMARMAKALSGGCPPCVITNMGSYSVWNTKTP